jgi:hypothetical protein
MAAGQMIDHLLIETAANIDGTPETKRGRSGQGPGLRFPCTLRAHPPETSGDSTLAQPSLRVSRDYACLDAFAVSGVDETAAVIEIGTV